MNKTLNNATLITGALCVATLAVLKGPLHSPQCAACLVVPPSPPPGRSASGILMEMRGGVLCMTIGVYPASVDGEVRLYCGRTVDKKNS